MQNGQSRWRILLAERDAFIGPSWCLDKPAVKLAVEQEMERRDTWQGKRYG